MSHPIDPENVRDLGYSHDLQQQPEAAMAAATAGMAAAMAVMAAMMTTRIRRCDLASKYLGYLKQVFVSENCIITSVDVHTLDSTLCR